MTTISIGPRVQYWREKRNLTQTDVAVRLGIKDRQTISAIETGERQIKADELLGILQVLGVTLDDLTNPFKLLGEGSFNWRQHGLPIDRLARYEETAGSWIAIYRHYAATLGIKPPLRRPKLPLSSSASYEQAMEAGERVCSELELGPVPADRLITAMEEKYGILVLMVDAEEGISGAACRLPEIDAILVNRREVIGRRNFDLAHELFHIMTWEQMPPARFEDTSKKTKDRVERLADNFAGALLMPVNILIRFGEWTHLGSAELVRKLNETADELRVTAKALKWRLFALKMLKETFVSVLDDALIRNNGRLKSEDEVPSLFSKKFNELIAKVLDLGLLSRRRAAQELSVELHELDQLLLPYSAALAESV
ncbi:MAG: XRE family transcriptional regulator [Asticcacaulis sp.]|uniref:helix-turn-helix domain-containing protein n=1 Tax=Asticcacaulis sp. TaxID=1872648 RepID=UPI0025C4F144|nr:XRE family transcriptional regulator [Asticcacaulis sp.]MCA1935137.1 XRE family transcriptional regulator [Asticcacaulis sp.]